MRNDVHKYIYPIQSILHNMNRLYEQFHAAVLKYANDKVILLRDKEVTMWLCGQLEFLQLPDTYEKKNKTKDNEQYKTVEDLWGQKKLAIRRPDLKPSGQWTTKLGEHICEEFQYLFQKNCSKPIRKNNFEPDVETEDAIWEVKTQTYYTSGTAGEKILGVPVKYADVPLLYDKELKILCIGYAEKCSRDHYGILPGIAITERKQKMLDFYHSMNISYVGTTDLMKQYVEDINIKEEVETQNELSIKNVLHNDLLV